VPNQALYQSTRLTEPQEAQITAGGKQVFLDHFADVEQARLAYEEALPVVEQDRAKKWTAKGLQQAASEPAAKVRAAKEQAQVMVEH
jgi:hypothetical protein